MQRSKRSANPGAYSNSLFRSRSCRSRYQVSQRLANGACHRLRAACPRAKMMVSHAPKPMYERLPTPLARVPSSRPVIRSPDCVAKAINRPRTPTAQMRCAARELRIHARVASNGTASMANGGRPTPARSGGAWDSRGGSTRPRIQLVLSSFGSWGNVFRS